MSGVNRRNFVKAVSAAPLILKGRTLLSEASSPGKVGVRDVVQADERFHLTLRRVLEGEAPRYSDDFLLADVKPTAERRFTEYSGDLSGRYIGALATAARVYGTHDRSSIPL